MSKSTTVMLTMTALALGALPAAASAPIVGQVATNDVRLDGAAVPAGTTVFSGSSVATGEAVAVLHLANGRSVALDKNSRATLADAGRGDVRLAVDEGRASFNGSGGEPVMVMANRTVLVLQEGQPGEGGVRMVQLCTLDAAGNWQLTSYPATEVDARLAAGDVYPGPNNQIGLDADCNEEKDGYWAGLTQGQRTAWILGLGAGAIVLGNELLEDSPASP